MNCNFEKGICSYESSSRIFFLGSFTPSKNTGPQKPYSGNFCFYEATNGMKGFQPFIQSPIVKFRENSCLSFVYHMFGQSIGNFTVKTVTYLKDGSEIEDIILKRQGNYGNSWLKHNHTFRYDPEKAVSFLFNNAFIKFLFSFYK